jgi:hypothetical protein
MVSISLDLKFFDSKAFVLLQVILHLQYLTTPEKLSTAQKGDLSIASLGAEERFNIPDALRIEYR